jgi:hypothetical protein
MKIDLGRPNALHGSSWSSWWILPALLAAPCVSIGTAAAWQDLPLVTPTAGMTIDRSVRVAPGRYRLEAPADDAPAITIRGENILVDFTGVTLEGGDPFADPDAYRGTGVLVDGGRGVTMRGGATWTNGCATARRSTLPNATTPKSTTAGRCRARTV